MARIILTDAEWMSVIDMERDGLPICCANISALRDEVIDMARQGEEVSVFNGSGFLRAYRWCQEGHTMESLPVIQKILTQVLAQFPQEDIEPLPGWRGQEQFRGMSEELRVLESLVQRLKRKGWNQDTELDKPVK